MLKPYFFIYRLLLTVWHLNEHWQVRLHIEQDAGSFWISWLSFYHNFRGVIREATQHFTSCYKILKWQIAADLFSVRSRWENGAGSIIRRRKDRPPCARLFVWTETGSDRVLEAVCWDWVIKTGMRSDQHPCYDCFCRTRPFLKSTLYPEFMTDIFLLQPEEGRPV